MALLGKISFLVALVAIAFLWVERKPMARSYPLLNALRPDGFSPEQMPSLEGKVAIVTGGTAGLGFESVKQLYKAGAHVFLTARSIAKGEKAKESILKQVTSATSGKIEVMELELNSLRSVHDFAKKFLAKKLPLHILMLNAGVMAAPYGLSQDGIETQFAVNHIAHFYLTKLLLPLVRESQPSNIVSLSSGAHRSAPPHGVGLNLTQINDQSAFFPFTAYGQSKLANILFVKHLSKVILKNNDKVFVNAVHPGFVKTDLMNTMISHKTIPEWALNLAPTFANLVGYAVDRAVWTQLWAAASPEIEKKRISGEYIVPIARIEKDMSHPLADDFDLAAKLWQFSEQLVQEKTKGF